MNEYSTAALQYGHLGRLKYDPESQSWKFPRTLTPAPSLHYAGAARTTVPSPLTVQRSSSSAKKSLIPQAYPELGPCWPQFRNETLSNAISKTSEVCDPLVSSLLDIGYAVDIENDDSGNRLVPIAAVASGECGNAISLYRIEEDTVELRQDATAEVRVPSIEKSENVHWSLGGAPVRQICFGQTVEEKATWMAARFPHSTIIFRPLYHRKPKSARIYQHGEPANPIECGISHLDANPLVEISCQQTGGCMHADVTFNPWYPKQLGIVDVSGSWGIWNISGRHKRNKGNWAGECIKSGSLPWLDNGDSQVTDDCSRYDGWAIIEWASDFNSFIVSDRRCPILYRMENDQVYSFPIELDLKRTSEWILDIKRSACKVSHVSILTTSRVFWLDIALDPASTAARSTRRSLYPRLSWHHFRDPEDTTLQLSPLLVHQELYLVLSSRLNNLVLTFHCPTASKDHTDTASVPDPFVLEVPTPYEPTSAITMPLNTNQFSSLCFKEITYLPSSLGKKHYDPAAKLIKLFLLDSHLSVREIIYTRPCGDDAADEHVLEKDILRLRRRYPGVATVSSKQSLDGFIVDDWDESVFGANARPTLDTKLSRCAPLAPRQWTLDYSHAYAIAIGSLILSKEGEGLSSVGKCLRDLIEHVDVNTPGAAQTSHIASHTLLEASGKSRWLLDDIDQNARDLRAFFSSIESSRSSWSTSNQKISVLNPPDLFGMPSSTAPDLEGVSAPGTLVEVYDRLVNDWLAVLPYGIPGRTRIMKEKVIRSVAADLALAQISVTHPPSQANDDATWNTSRSQPNEPLPDLAMLSFPGDQNLGPPGAISLGESSDREDGVPEFAEDLAAVCSSLSSLTTFSSKRPLSRSTTIMIQHWQLGTDPTTYNWHQTTQMVDGEDPQRAFLTTASQRKPRKKVPGGSQGASQPHSALTPPASSAAPVVRDWGSQPDNGEPPAIRLQSSQPVEDDLPMTQIERGMFGGREASRKVAMRARKKKRAAGF
ncbi:hypothetical protein P170DRAFT_514348 [Aspergillus steynii IBT 23096]|uniref:RNA polymerase I-specific transcription initiation factor RRN6-like protein n=1 Tax=Aspergillus steynii IBT 23096 TaxID=1392250 RepID=A0A2I2FTU6_9EURO|nr:uncharacterized protein P170DRAFT_514348 [Aspergillus steynii IBT 23096]PLB44063.1 hypothetical protein P170DRAFT_514348 [Aspergillus steynii IBT 23096]